MPLLPHKQRSPEWYSARKGKITASSAAGCLGLDPYDGPLATFNKITGKTTTDDNKHMAWGREFESKAREAYECLSGHFVTETGFWVHDLLPWLGASPDGLIGGDGLVEIKCPSKIPTAIPEHHTIQMIVQMACTGREWCDYFVWVGQEEYCCRLHRDVDHEHDILLRLEDFFQAYIFHDIAPPRKRPVNDHTTS